MQALDEPTDALWQRLIGLNAIRQQQAAFACATGLPLALLPAHKPAGSAGGAAPAQGLFCVKGCMGGQSGNLCQRLFQSVEKRAAHARKPEQYRCPTGLIKILAPVFVGEQHVGNLVAGPFSWKKLDETTFRHLKTRLEATGQAMQIDRLRTSWRYSPVIDSERGQALATMVSLFAQYLSECAGRLLREEDDMQSPLLRKVETVLRESRDQSLTVRELAERVSLSPCHFCKVFKKQTGVTFTEYRVRLRVERSKELLVNPNFRISEIAFESGFDSIQYFNRVFRRLVGCSPSEYRSQKRAEIQAKKSTNGA